MEGNVNYKLYNKIYGILSKVTPLKSDCGRLCDGKCCKGDSETGMIMFPGEPVNFPVTEKEGRKILVCSGICDRKKRPLSCMIFPLFPYKDKKRVKVRYDLRGNGICPLVFYSDNVRLQNRFVRSVKRVGRLLYKDPECAALLEKINDEIDQAESIIDSFSSKYTD